MSDGVERPGGVTFAAVLLLLSGLVGGTARALSLPDPGAAVWLVVHIASLILAVGLLKLRRWAYWLFLVSASAGIVLSLARLVGTAEASLGPTYQFVRILIMVAWIVYFRSWRVRAAFAPPGSGYGR
jgi:bacteriorhodopsin